MRNISKTITLFCVSLLPFQGYCSYMADALNFGKEAYYSGHSYERGIGLEKCLLLIDMIEGTKDTAKKSHLKTILEFHLLAVADRFLWEIERTEKDLAYQNKCLEEATTEKDRGYWSIYVLESMRAIEELQHQRDRIRELLKYTL